MLPTDSKARKRIPVFSGVFKYFPLAVAALAEHSREGNEQHNPGEPLHWAREKSSDHPDCIARHLLDYAQGDRRTMRAIAWRAMAQLQLDEEDRLHRAETVKAMFEKISTEKPMTATEVIERIGKTGDAAKFLLTDTEKRPQTGRDVFIPWGRDPGDEDPRADWPDEVVPPAFDPAAKYTCQHCLSSFYTVKGLSAHLAKCEP